MLMIVVVLVYFALLFAISRWTARRATNETFYRADRRSPWPMVAFGMVGASISGITFVSVPGMVLRTQMTYLQTCFGFVLGYMVVALVLLPLYYHHNLTSIYAYLAQRMGRRSHQTGAAFFLLSKMMSATARFYVVCIILQHFVFQPLGVPFALTVVGLVLLIWLYTRHGGIKTLVWTDSLQTLCLLTALLLIIYYVATDLELTPTEIVAAVKASELSRVFVWDDWVSKQLFWKQFLSGVFIVVVMTGLDQDMMQKNLTCRTLRGAQKDMFSYGLAFVPVNLLFLSLGVLLVLWYQQHGMPLPASGDELLPVFVKVSAESLQAEGLGASVLQVFFVLGIVAASFSSADSALTSLTTIWCVDLRQRMDDVRLRRYTHLAMCGCFVVFILLFRLVNSTSLIDAIYIIVSYTYGPLLGLFAYGMFSRRIVNDKLVPYIALASPVLCFAIDSVVGRLVGYRFGYELLMLNGLLTFSGLWLTGHSPKSYPPSSKHGTGSGEPLD